MVQKIAIGLTVVNLAVLGVLVTQVHAASAEATPGMLRGTGLEIVDSHGRARATITIYEEGTPGSYPEVVVLRLIDRNGKPTVKLETHEAGGTTLKGSGLGLLGEGDSTQAFIGAEGPIAKAEMKDRNGERQPLRR